MGVGYETTDIAQRVREMAVRRIFNGLEEFAVIGDHNRFSIFCERQEQRIVDNYATLEGELDGAVGQVLPGSRGLAATPRSTPSPSAPPRGSTHPAGASARKR